MTDRQASEPMLLRRLGAALRDARKAAGMTQREVGAALARAQDTVSHVELGRKDPSDAELTEYLDLYGASPAVRKEVADLARQARVADRAWWAMFQDVFPMRDLQFFAYEDAATTVYSYEGANVPALAQVRGYTEAVVELGQADESYQRRSRFIQMRMLRRGILDHPNLTYHALISEMALQAQLATPEATLEQLQAITDFARHPRVHLRVIPFAAGVASIPVPPYQIMEFPEDPPCIYQEMTKGGELRQDPTAVEYGRRKYQRYLDRALNEQDSIQFIDEKMRSK